MSQKELIIEHIFIEIEEKWNLRLTKEGQLKCLEQLKNGKTFQTYNESKNLKSYSSLENLKNVTRGLSGECMQESADKKNAETECFTSEVVFNFLLNADIRQFGCSEARFSLDEVAKSSIEKNDDDMQVKSFFVQIMKIKDLTQPLRTCKVESCNSLFELLETSSLKILDNSERLLWMKFTSGSQQILAIEMETIKQLYLEILPGTKFLISHSHKHPLVCKHGIFLLKSENITILGGNVPSLSEFHMINESVKQKRKELIDGRSKTQESDCAPKFEPYKGQKNVQLPDVKGFNSIQMATKKCIVATPKEGQDLSMNSDENIKMENMDRRRLIIDEAQLCQGVIKKLPKIRQDAFRFTTDSGQHKISEISNVPFKKGKKKHAHKNNPNDHFENKHYNSPRSSLPRSNKVSLLDYALRTPNTTKHKLLENLVIDTNKSNIYLPKNTTYAQNSQYNKKVPEIAASSYIIHKSQIPNYPQHS